MPKEEIVHSITSILFALLILVGLVLILSFCWRPTKILEKSRDAHRVEDLQDLTNAVNLYLADNKNFDTLKIGEEYIATVNNNQIDGSGWIPLDFQSISSGAPLGKLPIDPLNDTTYQYSFGVNVVDKTFEIDGILEEGNNQKKMLEDSGNNPARYEVGTDLTILR